MCIWVSEVSLSEASLDELRMAGLWLVVETGDRVVGVVRERHRVCVAVEVYKVGEFYANRRGDRDTERIHDPEGSFDNHSSGRACPGLLLGD